MKYSLLHHASSTFTGSVLQPTPLQLLWDTELPDKGIETTALGTDATGGVGSEVGGGKWRLPAGAADSDWWCLFIAGAPPHSRVYMHLRAPPTCHQWPRGNSVQMNDTALP